MSNRIDDAKAIATDVFGEDDVIRRVDAVEALAEWGISPLVLMPVPSTQKWIPCSERLPKEYAQYLVCFEDGECYVYWLDDSDWARGLIEKENIIAWMPLPESYKGGDGND